MEEKCAEIEESIKLSMELGLSYTKYSGTIPSNILEMLETLGYKVIKTIDTTGFMAYNSFIITWGNDPDEDIPCE